jgi:hypothetical protein
MKESWEIEEKNFVKIKFTGSSLSYHLIKESNN